MIPAYAQQPARCLQTFRIENGSRPNYVIVPGVANCFSCALDAVGATVSWSVADGSVIRQLQTGSPFILTIANQSITIAEVEENYLILPAPEVYVLPGLVGRQDIFCSLATGSGEQYEARLISPGKIWSTLVLILRVLCNNLTDESGSSLRIQN